MKVEYLFFSVYLLTAIWVLPKIPFIKHTGLSARETRLLFGFKILTGILCAFYFQKLSGANDYLAHNRDGLAEYNLLLTHPLLFFTDITNDLKIYGFGGLLESSNSFWANLRSNLLFKFLGLLNLLTRGNFYMNTVFFCSLVFFGHVAFYRIYSEIYKGQKSRVMLACFFLPSLLMYTSCVHKDGLVFLSLGFISYIFFILLTSPNSIRTKHILVFGLSLLSIFLLRNYIIVAIMPAFIIAIIYKFVSYRRRLILPITYAFFFVLFFLSGFSKSHFNLPAAVVQRKTDFAMLREANTNIPMNELHPTFLSFASNLPQAINHVLFRPTLWEFRQWPVILTALELLIYQLLIVLLMIYPNKAGGSLSPFNLFGLALFVHMILIIGYTIPNIGAIVRYRSAFWIFLVCPVLCNINWSRLNFFNKKVVPSI